MGVNQDRRQSAATNMSNISSEDIEMHSAGEWKKSLKSLHTVVRDQGKGMLDEIVQSELLHFRFKWEKEMQNEYPPDTDE